MAANPKTNPDEFDPRRHRVFQVHVDLSYDAYVIAEDRAEAKEIAETEGRDSAEAFLDAYEVTKPVLDSGLPWGPNVWGDKKLTVNRALALIAEAAARPEIVPEPPPRIPLMEHRADLDWVRLASGDEEVPTLSGVCRIGSRVAACDAHRLHVVPVGSMRDGHWDPETGETIPAPFPGIDRIVPVGPPNLWLTDLPGVWEVLTAADAARQYVTIPTTALPTAWPAGGREIIAFDAGYLADALLGAMGVAKPTAVGIVTDTGSRPVRFDFAELGRMAIVMPIRPGSGGIPSPFDLGPFVKGPAR